jgi:outer membrane protein assembly factor BamB
LLIGGGGVGILVIAFLVLYFALTRGSAQDLLASANKSYAEGQYATAIAQYEQYVKKYPAESDVSAARLMIRASRIHQPYDAKDMNTALQVAERELPEMEKEETFDQIRGELESILPTIADHFASAARTATELKKMEEQVALAHAAMKLVNNASYLPTARREAQQARIDSILEKIRVAERTINQGKALVDAMTELQGKLTAGDVKGAYDVRAKLLQDYPTLQSHAEVVKNTLAISLRERDLVTTTPQTQTAATDDPNLPTHRQLLLARRSGENIGAPEGAKAFLLVRGTVYAVDVATGAVVWHRHVGAQTRALPLPVSGGDVVVVDQVHREALRLAGASGKVMWRQSFGEAASAPQLVGEHLFVTLESGRVVRLNAVNGELDRAAQLPQASALAAMPVAAGADAKGKVIYQPAEHSTIYALAADDTLGEPLSCRSAYYLGHPPGSIAVPPMVVVGYVFVFQNEGAASSLVHSLAVKKDGTLEAARDPVRLRGRVTNPPISLRSRLIVVSDLGDILVADVDPGNTASPVNVTAHKPGGLTQPTIGYPAVSGSRLFVADVRLAEYEIVATKQDLGSGESRLPGDAFVAPLQMFGTTLLHTRQRNGASSVTVTAENLSENKSWELTLSAPIVGVNAHLQQKQFAAVSSDGDLFEVGVDTFKEGVRDQPTSTTSGAAQSLSGAVPLADGKSLLWNRSGRTWVLQEMKAGGSLQRVNLQTGEGDFLSAPPVAWGGGILAPLAKGAVWLLDAATGAPLAGTTPFLPETMPGVNSRWLRPLVVDERQFVAIDAARKAIYLARREEKPMPFLAQTRLVEVDYEPVYGALVEKALLVVARGDTADEVVIYSLPGLQEASRKPLPGRIGARGLEVVGSQAFCQISNGELLSISAAGEVATRGMLANTQLSAAPLGAGNDLILVAQNGQVMRLSEGASELHMVANAGQPLTGAVQLMGTSLLAGGANGTLHVLPLGGAAKEEQP